MKKTLLVAIALMMSIASFAQFSAQPQAKGSNGAKDALPNWTPIGAAFVATDINGNTVSIADTLAAGKCIVIDYSATWCSWCWVLHSNHILEAIYNQLGDQVCVIWVEADEDTGPEGIYGNGTNTQGDWTNGGSIPYPIIDNPNTTSLVGGNITTFPSVYFVSPTGYYCDLYGTDWGFGPYEETSVAVSRVLNLINTYPRAGAAPIIAIDGRNAVRAGSPATFNASVVSVDDVTAVEWSFSNGSPATATGNQATTTWNAPGTETVTLSVTNTSGTTTATLSVNVFDYSNWGDTMDYPGNLSSEIQPAIGLSSGSAFSWGVKYPASLLEGRVYLNEVQIYGSENNARLTLNIYQTNQGGNPSNANLLYTFDYDVTANTWNSLPVHTPIQLDATKDLWVTFTGSGYVATGCTFNGDDNSCLLQNGSTWSPLHELSSQLSSTWLIRAVTNIDPSFSVGIVGPENVEINTAITYTAASRPGATFSWQIEGGEPATGNSATITTQWPTVGYYTITLTATYNGETKTATKRVSAVDCSTTLPFTWGFEPNESNYSCWNLVDADGDGRGWDFSNQLGSYAHTGRGIAASASFINNIGPLTPDNWMILPKINVPAEGATIEWWDYGQDINDFADHYGVFVSTTGNNTSDFTNTIYDGAPTSPRTWVKHSRSLAGYAGQTIYIAFRHFNITNMFWLLIDDINITAGDHASIEDVSNVAVRLFPNPTSNILNIAAEGVKEVSVMDINGRTVMTEQNATSIDMSELANGVYFVRVITNEGIATQKIVKK
jgi:hypothetical protein